MTNIITDAPASNFTGIGAQSITYPYKYWDGLAILKQEMLVDDKGYIPKVKEAHPTMSGYQLVDHEGLQTRGGDMYVIPCTFAKISGTHKEMAIEQVQFAGIKINEQTIIETYSYLTRVRETDPDTDEVTIKIEKEDRQRDLDTKGIVVRQPFTKPALCKIETKFYISNKNVIESTSNTRTDNYSYANTLNFEGSPKAYTQFIVEEAFDKQFKNEIDKFYRQKAHPNTKSYKMPTLPSYAQGSHEVKYITEDSKPNMGWYKGKIGKFDMVPFPTRVENMFGALWRVTNYFCRFE